MLELRPNCERCDVDLPPSSSEARICSYECTFCADCVEHHLRNVCPNCGGGFAARPIRPARSWRAATGLAYDPPSTARRNLRYSDDEIASLVESLWTVSPEER
jgi:uncharacterized protein